MNREYHKWWSPRLSRDMEMLVFGHSGAKVLVFPTRCGRFYEWENIGIVETLRCKIERGCLQLFCVDSIDMESFYCSWAHPSGRIQRHVQYEEYVLNEVLPLMAWKNPHSCTIVQGCSLGAFHAVNIATRHPHLFQKVVALSGRYDLTLQADAFGDLLDGYYDETVYYHTPLHFVPHLQCQWRLGHLRNMEITLAIGEQDPFRGNNEAFSRALAHQGIHHQLHVWHERAHSAKYWRKMVALYT